MNEYLKIEAEGGGRPKVTGLAYSGNKMSLPGWKFPVVVELSGMVIPENVPLLTNHQNKTNSRVGMVTASIKDNTLEITGEILSESEDAADIVAQSKAGGDWQLSIGADVKECELVKGAREVNGVTHEGPFYHVKRSELREVSVVAVGADAQTKMKVTASFNLTQETQTKGEEMSEHAENETVKANAVEAKKIEAKGEVRTNENVHEVAEEAIKAERERVAAIQSICAGDFPEIEKEAIRCGWTADVVTKKVLETIRAERPSASVNLIIRDKPEGSELRKTVEAAMCLRCGISADTLCKSYSESVVEAGMRDMDMPLKQLLIECMHMDGIPTSRSFDNETIRAAFSSVSLPGILSNVANKKMLQSYNAQPVIATKLCTSGDLNDFKENDRFRLTDVGDLLPVAPDGEIKDGGVVEESAKNQLETYGKKFCLTRKMIINDDLGAFMKVPTAMGNRAARLIDQLFFSRLLSNPTQSDNKALFHTGHKNLLTGTTSALSSDSLKKGIQTFLDQVDADGQPISVEPTFLLVPTALKHLAIELTRGATLVMSGGSNNVVRPAINVLADENLQVVSSPYLSNSAYTGNSTTAWYLFGAPGQVDTFEIGYLNGKRTPTVERGETDFNTLGMWFRVYFDLGIREQDFRGMVKSNGAA